MRMVLSSPNLDHVNVEHALQQLNQRTVDSAMSKSVFTVDEDDLVVEAVKIMVCLLAVFTNQIRDLVRSVAFQY
jgi:predicted transcriptional regulator